MYANLEAASEAPIPGMRALLLQIHRNLHEAAVHALSCELGDPQEACG